MGLQEGGERLVVVPADDAFLGHEHPLEDGLVHQPALVVVTPEVRLGALADKRGLSNLEPLLREAIRAEIGRGSGGVFVELMEAMTLALRQVVHIEDASAVAYLQPLLELASPSEALVIATLNYDRSIELLAATHGVGCTTAIEEWATGTGPRVVLGS